MLICAQTGEQLENVQAHEFDHQINDIQFSQDRTYFITASKDKSAKVCSDRFRLSYVVKS
jgi:translation initiation factor 3 subunit I